MIQSSLLAGYYKRICERFTPSYMYISKGFPSCHKSQQLRTRSVLPSACELKVGRICHDDYDMKGY